MIRAICCRADRSSSLSRHSTPFAAGTGKTVDASLGAVTPAGIVAFGEEDDIAVAVGAIAGVEEAVPTFDVIIAAFPPVIGALATTAFAVEAAAAAASIAAEIPLANRGACVTG